MKKTFLLLFSMFIFCGSAFAGDELKNVTVLKDMDKPALKTYMKKMSKEIGQKCSFCHNTKDFASDENHHKEIARKMITMTNDLNKNVFNYEGAEKITCYTCHAGNKKPVNKLPNSEKK